MIVHIAPGPHRTGCKGPNPRHHSPRILPIPPRSAEVGINAITSYKEHLSPSHESIRRPSQWGATKEMGACVEQAMPLNPLVVKVKDMMKRSLPVPYTERERERDGERRERHDEEEFTSRRNKPNT